MRPTDLIAKWHAEAEKLREPETVKPFQFTRAIALTQCANELEAALAEDDTRKLALHLRGAMDDIMLIKRTRPDVLSFDTEHDEHWQEALNLVNKYAPKTTPETQNQAQG